LQAPVRPATIRFFRNAMFNMINIALGEVDVTVRPCRTTYALYNWLEARERDVYPAMEGYAPTMSAGTFFDIRWARLSLPRWMGRWASGEGCLARYYWP
jgi:RNA-binding protein Tab2/Atab2